VIVAEGYTDVIAMHQAGLRNTVGLMGTALTEEQVGELARLAPRVQLALDADGAGQEAMLRAARVAAGRRLELRVVPLPPGTDPADLVQGEGARALRELDVDETFTSELTRRAARHLREHLDAPAEGVPAEDTELAALVAQLAVRAARNRGSAAALEGEALNLELLRLERAITAARGSGDVAPLSARRAELRRRRDSAIERAMEETQPVE
jgi:DNA primase